MYGDLQGLNKTETAKKYGDAQVKIWRRSYDVRPPGGESLKDTAERVLPYYEKMIRPCLLKGETVIIAAHGNSLRALVMELDQLSKEAVLELNIPTGVPLLYEFDDSGKVLSHRYL
jgi:2,3-bisphosphoglycerate-dependent phosphoglycerate mutase